jgi:CheY-like chemotaxis protein
VTELKNLFDGAGKSADALGRQQTFEEIARRLNSFKEDCSAPEFLPVWQLATALEALLKHLSRQESNVTPSCLRSTAGGLELLQRLCGQKFRPDLATNPPIKLLVVDDDPVSRMALSAALKRAFTPPDQAHDGESALAMIDRNTYDIVFLDVEMPGLDGFEVCSRIHQTPLNRTTPVVFVTQHRDFEYRVKAASCGGYELIEKPFVSFEIAVKALTLVFGARFDKAGAQPEASKLAPADTATREVVKAEELPAAKTQTATASGDSAGSQERFDKLFIGAQALVSQAQSLKLNSAQRLGAVLQDVLTEFVKRPDTRTSVTFATAESALALLGELCGSKSDPNLAEPAVRILVVDDDPIARRAVALSIQSVFGKPASADSGEAAVSMAEKESFDLVFMDVLMPGMNGFAACAKIHETASNRETPVVFVTAKSDETSKNEALAAGGSGFIAKPISSKGILLTALTFALRARLKRSKTSPALAEAVC